MYFIKNVFLSTMGHGSDKLSIYLWWPRKGLLYQNYKFHDPRGRASCAGAWRNKSYGENALYLWNFCFLLLGADQTNYVQSNDEQGRFYQNFNDDLRAYQNCQRYPMGSKYDHRAVGLEIGSRSKHIHAVQGIGINADNVLFPSKFFLRNVSWKNGWCGRSK